MIVIRLRHRKGMEDPERTSSEQMFEITVTKGARVVQVYEVPASKLTRQHRIWSLDMGGGRPGYKLAVRAL